MENSRIPEEVKMKAAEEIVEAEQPEASQPSEVADQPKVNVIFDRGVDTRGISAEFGKWNAGGMGV